MSDKSQEMLTEAAQALDDGHIDQAIALYRGIVQTGGPDALSATFGLAVCVARRKQWEEAESLLTEVIANSPEFAIAHAYLGAVQLSLGNIEEAEESSLIALRLAPGNAVVRVKYAEMLLRLGRSTEAVEELQKAGALGSSDKTLTGYIRQLNLATKKDLKHAIVRTTPSLGMVWQQLRSLFTPEKRATSTSNARF